MLDAVDAPAGSMEVVLGAGDSGILLHEAIGHGLEADFNRKETSNYSGQLGKRVASRAVHRRRRRHHQPHARRHQRRRRGQPGPQERAHRERHPARVHAGPAVVQALRRGAVGQRASPELPPQPAAAHDQHRAARRAARSRGDHPLGQARRLRQALLRRAGQHLQRRLRLLADRVVPHRGRQARPRRSRA